MDGQVSLLTMKKAKDQYNSLHPPLHLHQPSTVIRDSLGNSFRRLNMKSCQQSPVPCLLLLLSFQVFSLYGALKQHFADTLHGFLLLWFDAESSNPSGSLCIYLINRILFRTEDLVKWNAQPFLLSRCRSPGSVSLRTKRSRWVRIFCWLLFASTFLPFFIFGMERA